MPKRIKINNRALEEIVRSYYFIGQPGSELPGDTTIREQHVAGEELAEISMRVYKSMPAGATSEVYMHIVQVEGEIVLANNYWFNDKFGKRLLPIAQMLFLNKEKLWAHQLTPMDFAFLIQDSKIDYADTAKAAYDANIGKYDIAALQSRWLKGLEGLSAKQKEIAAVVAAHIDNGSKVNVYFNRASGYVEHNDDINRGHHESMEAIIDVALRLSWRGIHAERTEYSTDRINGIRICADSKAQAVDIELSGDHRATIPANLFEFYYTLITKVLASPVPVHHLQFAKTYRRILIPPPIAPTAAGEAKTATVVQTVKKLFNR